MDAGTGEVAAHVLTDGNTDDAAEVPGLLRGAEGRIVSLTVDGVHGGEPTYEAVISHAR